MAKSKFAPALFEVIKTRPDAKDGGKLSVPKWWWRGSQSNAAETTESESSEQRMSLQQGDSTPAAPEDGLTPQEEGMTASSSGVKSGWSIAALAREIRSRPPFASAVSDLEDPPPAVQVDGGRLALSLNPVTATVVAGAIMLTLLSTYLIGRHWGSSGSKQTTASAGRTDELSKLLNGPARTEALKATTPPPRSRSGIREREVASPRPTGVAMDIGTARNAAPIASPPVKPSSPHYVVLESFKAADKKSAEFARDWLEKKKSIKTNIETRGNSILLVSAETFDFGKAGEEQRSKQYLETIKSLGKTIGGDMAGAKLSKYVFSKPAMRAAK